MSNQQIDIEIQLYAEQHKLYQQNLTKYVRSADVIEITKNIYKNIDQMTPDELLENYKKIISPEYIKRELLLFELDQYIPDKLDNLSPSNYIQTVLSIFEFYRNCSDGNLLEDITWIVHDKTSTKYPVKDDEILFENSIGFNGDEDSQNITSFRIDSVHKYIKLIRRYLNRLAPEIKVTERLIEDPKNDICWIILKCKSPILLCSVPTS